MMKNAKLSKKGSKNGKIYFKKWRKLVLAICSAESDIADCFAYANISAKLKLNAKIIHHMNKMDQGWYPVSCSGMLP